MEYRLFIYAAHGRSITSESVKWPSSAICCRPEVNGSETALDGDLNQKWPRAVEWGVSVPESCGGGCAIIDTA